MTRVELPYNTIDSLTDLNMALSVNILLVSSDAQFNHILGPKIQSRLQGKFLEYSEAGWGSLGDVTVLCCSWEIRKYEQWKSEIQTNSDFSFWNPNCLEMGQNWTVWNPN